MAADHRGFVQTDRSGHLLCDQVEHAVRHDVAVAVALILVVEMIHRFVLVEITRRPLGSIELVAVELVRKHQFPSRRPRGRRSGRENRQCQENTFANLREDHSASLLSVCSLDDRDY